MYVFMYLSVMYLCLYVCMHVCVGPLARRRGTHGLMVIFGAISSKIELEAGAVCSISDSCLPEARGFELLTDFAPYA